MAVRSSLARVAGSPGGHTGHADARPWGGLPAALGPGAPELRDRPLETPRDPRRAQGRCLHRSVRVLLAHRCHREVRLVEAAADLGVAVEVLPVPLTEGLTC